MDFYLDNNSSPHWNNCSFDLDGGGGDDAWIDSFFSNQVITSTTVYDPLNFDDVLLPSPSVTIPQCTQPLVVAPPTAAPPCSIFLEPIEEEPVVAVQQPTLEPTPKSPQQQQPEPEPTPELDDSVIDLTVSSQESAAVEPAATATAAAAAPCTIDYSKVMPGRIICFDKPIKKHLEIKIDPPSRSPSPCPTVASSVSSLASAVRKQAVIIDDDESGDEYKEPVTSSESESENDHEPLFQPRQSQQPLKRKIIEPLQRQQRKRNKTTTYEWCRIQLVHYQNRRVFELNWKVNGRWCIYETVPYGPGKKFTTEASAYTEALRIIRGN